METDTKTRKAHLPMVLCDDKDLELINTSDLSPFQRDIAIRYVMATYLVNSLDSTLETLKDDMHLVHPVYDFLDVIGKKYIAQNTLNPIFGKEGSCYIRKQ